MARAKKITKATQTVNQPLLYRLHSYLLNLCKEGEEIPRVYQIAHVLGVNERTVGRNCAKLAKEKLIKYVKGHILAVKIDNDFVEVTQTQAEATYSPVTKEKLYKYLCQKSPNIPRRADIAIDLHSNVRALYKPLKKLEKEGLIKFRGDHENSIMLVNEKQIGEDDYVPIPGESEDDEFFMDESASSATKPDPEDIEISNSTSSHRMLDVHQGDITEKDKIESTEFSSIWEPSTLFNGDLMGLGLDETFVNLGEYGVTANHVVDANELPVGTEDKTQDELADLFFTENTVPVNPPETLTPANKSVEQNNASDTDKPSNNKKTTSDSIKLSSENTKCRDLNEMVNELNSLAASSELTNTDSPTIVPSEIPANNSETSEVSSPVASQISTPSINSTFSLVIQHVNLDHLTNKEVDALAILANLPNTLIFSGAKRPPIKLIDILPHQNSENRAGSNISLSDTSLKPF